MGGSYHFEVHIVRFDMYTIGLLLNIFSVLLMINGFKHMMVLKPQQIDYNKMPCMHCVVGHMEEVAELTYEISRYRCDNCGTEIVF